MTFGEKLQALRRRRGWSQERLASEIEISRQAVSKWESGTAIPDTENVLRISRLFGVSTDYLLHDEFDSDRDSPAYQTGSDDARASQNRRTALCVLIGIQALALLGELIGWMVAQAAWMVLLGLMLQLAGIVGLEAGYRRYGTPSPEARRAYRLFYQISVWLFGYFPIRMAAGALLRLYPRPYPAFMPAVAAVLVYVAVCAAVTLRLQKTK